MRRNPLYSDVTDADLQAQFDLAIQIRDKISEANNAVIQIRDIKREVADRLTQVTGRAAQDRRRPADDEPERGRGGDLPGEEPERPGSAQLPDQDQQPPGVAAARRQHAATASRSATRAPIFKDLIAELKVQTDRLAKVLATDLPAFNTEAKRVGAGVVTGK